MNVGSTLSSRFWLHKGGRNGVAPLNNFAQAQVGYVEPEAGYILLMIIREPLNN